MKFTGLADRCQRWFLNVKVTWSNHQRKNFILGRHVPAIYRCNVETFVPFFLYCLYHIAGPQDSIKEIEKLKPLLSMNNDASGEQLGRRCKHNIDGLRSPSQRWTKKILSFSSFKETKVLFFLQVWWFLFNFFAYVFCFLHDWRKTELDCQIVQYGHATFLLCMLHISQF